jgi:hypothetical protein
MRYRLMLALVAALHGCGADRPAIDPAALLLTVDDTLVRPADGKVAQPVDLAVDRAAQVYLSDPGDHRVVVLDATGAVLRTIGREGHGPGEMGAPRSLSVAGDSLRVLDVGNDQVHVFTAAGEFVRSYGGLPGTSIAEVAFNGSGDGVIARHGLGNALALRFGPAGQVGSTLGTPAVPPDLQYDFAAGKQELAAGRIPPMLRNYSAPALGEDGSAWVLHIVDGTVDRYSPTDSLLWTATLPDTLLTRLHSALFERTRQDTSVAGFYFPTVLLDARPVGDTLWLLLQGAANQPAEFALLGPTGTWLRPIRVTGATSIWRFAVDPVHHALYLLDKGEGTLLHAPLPVDP